MKHLSKLMALVLVLAMIVVFIPALEAPASAAGSDFYISFTNESHENPILDFYLDFETFKAGGPFHLSLETKVENIKPWVHPFDGTEDKNYSIKTYIEGTKFGTTEKQAATTNDYSRQGSGWNKYEYDFENVGFIGVSGQTIPCNIMRTFFWHCTGTVSIRNVLIKNAAGEVVYDMNADKDLQAMVADMKDNDVTESDMSNLASFNEDAPWCPPAGFGIDGTKYAKVVLSAGSKPTTPTTTKPATTPTTEKPTEAPTEAPTQAPTEAPTQAPTEAPTQAPTEAPTQAPTQAPTTNDTNNGQPSGGINTGVLIAIIVVVVLGITAVVLFATGVIGKKKN